MIKKSEKKVMQYWGNIRKPLVSICCTTFNHGPYLSQAIDSFLMQKTDFPFEILIRDDCSTDDTREIIKQYSEMYPNIISPVLESENTFSKGIKPLHAILPFAQGEFIALCEGDDYWISPQKLAEQIEIFRKNPDISLCFHPAMEENLLTDENKVICRHFKGNCIVDLRRVILGRGGYMPTASLVFKNNNIGMLIKSYKNAPIGDVFVQIFMTAIGKCYYLDQTYSVYRRNSPQSWTYLQKDRQQRRQYAIQMLDALDNFYPYIRFHPESKELHQVYFFYAVKSLDHSGNRRSLIYEMIKALIKVKYLDKWYLILLILRARMARLARKFHHEQ